MPPPKNSVSRRKTPIQTFDPESFDIHAMDKGIRSKIMPLQRGEKVVHPRPISKEKDINKKPRISFLVALFSNIVIPGLGNVYVKRSPFSWSILVLSLIVIVTTFSPVFPIVQFLNWANIPTPAHAATATTLFVPGDIMLDNQLTLVGPTFSILLVPLLLTWIFFVYLLLHHDTEIKWSL
ncbi:MAG: hypothetical protein Q8P05_01270 [Candidatus Diapherotrites archaeon]|nr:hypothetical protein [Candidatus Diapherotrites archaeon]MDZ4255976.1 hypothetical protein [archaeon]